MRLSLFAHRDGAFMLGWVVCWLMCKLHIAHQWMFDGTLRVPYYGTGHEQCLVCGLIRVKP